MSIEAAQQTKVLSVDAIKPYHRNPRRIPPEAIDAVADSIERYGYQQPIVVDKDNVIVVGHTRHLALQKLGVKKVQVYVTDLPEAKVNEYRLVDNRTSEMTSWDHESLVMELREFEEGLLKRYFPEIDLEVGVLKTALDVTAGEVEAATKKALSVKEARVHPLTKVECPACFHTFEVKTASLPGLTHSDMRELNGATQ